MGHPHSNIPVSQCRPPARPGRHKRLQTRDWGTAPGAKGVSGWEIGVATIGPSQHELFPEPQAALSPFHPLRNDPPVVLGTATTLTRRSTHGTGLSPSLGRRIAGWRHCKLGIYQNSSLRAVLPGGRECCLLLWATGKVSRCTGGIWRWKRKRPWPLDRIRCAKLSPRQPGTVVSDLVNAVSNGHEVGLAWSGNSKPAVRTCPTSTRVPNRGRRPNFPKRSTFLRVLENSMY